MKSFLRKGRSRLNQPNHSDKPAEECGVFGICRKDSGEIARQVYHGLYALQHRGQESCGIAVNDDDGILCYKDTAL